MSNLKLEEVKGKKKGKIENVVFAYVKLQDGAYQYQSKTQKEYTVDVIVDKATAKDYKKQFPKNGYKEIETKDFESKYKIPAPFPDQDEQYVVKVKADAHLAADVPSVNLSKGDLIPYDWAARPKVFVPVEGGVEDITMETLVANGSKGTVAFSVMSNSYGDFPQLTGILVTDLIEYISTGGASSDFGSVVGGYKAGNGEVQQKASTGAVESVPAQSNTEVAGATQTTPTDVQNGVDDDIPFN